MALTTRPTISSFESADLTGTATSLEPTRMRSDSRRTSIRFSKPMLAFLPTCPHFLGPRERTERPPDFPSSSEIRGPESGSSSLGLGLDFLPPPRRKLAPGPPNCTLLPDPSDGPFAAAGSPRNAGDDPAAPPPSGPDPLDDAVDFHGSA